MLYSGAGIVEEGGVGTAAVDVGERAFFENGTSGKRPMLGVSEVLAARTFVLLGVTLSFAAATPTISSSTMLL
jgi:hypothetical protein